MYSPDAAKGGVRFENELGSEFNISGPLNTLMRKKLLRQPFILWTSSNKVVVIRD